MISEFHWQIPTKIHGGENQSQACYQYCQDLGLQRPLVVTDSGLINHPVCQQLVLQLNEKGLDAQLFGEVGQNPTCDNVTAGVKAFKKHQADGIVAMGGGSALDAAKAIALMVNQSLDITHFVDEGTRWMDAMLPIYPVIAIPTTAGTGSEVGRCAVIVDTTNQRKLVLFHPSLLPEHVILDPICTISLPAHLTAFTGMDALSHNLEALCVDSFHPVCDGIAVQGIKLIAQNLLTAYKAPDNLYARTQMLVASSMGAIAFQKGLGAMHALSHAIGGLYGGHHGMLNAILMPYVLSFNHQAIEDKCQSLATAIGLESPSFESLMGWILNMREQLAVPDSLNGLFDFDIDKVVANALIDPCASTNPIQLDAKALEQILSHAIEGHLCPQIIGEISKLKA